MSEEQEFSIGEDEQLIAMDMLLRGAFAPHLCCDHGIAPPVLMALVLNVLGAVAYESGMSEKALADPELQKNLFHNFEQGYMAASMMVAQQEMAGKVLQ